MVMDISDIGTIQTKLQVMLLMVVSDVTISMPLSAENMLLL